MSPLVGLLLGIVLLLAGGTFVVRSASSIAARYGISPVVVGLTIVAFGTSAPELVVNLIGAMRDQTELAFGNVVGSNLANLGLVLGIAAAMRPIEINGQIVRRELPLLLLATAVLVVMAADQVLRASGAAVDRSEAIVLLLLFGIFLYISVQDVIGQRGDDTLIANIAATPLVKTESSVSYDGLQLLGGFVALLVGGHVTVSHGVALGELWGVPSTIIGLFAVAIGTSLPELVTTVIAAVRGESDLAVGNVVGSNLFNSLIVMPASAMVRSVSVPEGGLVDLFVSLGFAVALIPLFWYGRARMGWRSGLMFCGVYVLYAIFRLQAST